MLKKLSSFLLILVSAVLTVIAYQSIEGKLLRWLVIFFLMILSMGLASLILKEEPMEFFDDFSNYKNARVSAIFLIGAVVSAIKAFTAFVEIIAIASK